MRGAAVSEIHGPFIHAPVWSWEVATYFWFGGMASGAAFVALACDTAGDHRSAAIARKVVLGAVAPAPVLLIADLGRPERFLNMMRIFKPRSLMNTGAWCLVAFSGSAAMAVAADLGERAKGARALGGLTALFGSYLGSYTGVLLACTAVPVWARSRTILGPAFVATATATGRPGIYFRTGKSLVALGISLRLIARRTGRREHELASFMYLAAGLAFRLAWVSAGKASAANDATVAAMARGRRALHDDHEEPVQPRAVSARRPPLPLPDTVRRAYGETIRRTSLAIERRLRRRRAPRAE